MPKEITKYQCIVCGTKWGCREAAAMCESEVLPPCPCKVGDAVEVPTRYNGAEKDVVVGVSIARHYMWMYADDMRDGDVNTFMTRWNELKERLRHPMEFHMWVVTVKHKHKVGKDDDAYSDEFTLDNVRFPGAELALDGTKFFDCSI